MVRNKFVNMTMCKLVTFGLLFVNIGLVYSQGFYKVVSPRVIRPNSEYHAAVSIFQTSTPSTVTVALIGRSNSGRAFSSEEIINVQPYSTRIARLQIGDIEPGDYRVLVRSRGGIEFDTSSAVKYVRKSYSVFIQTDKAVYKPGSKILFRAIVLNSQLKPAAEVRNEPITVQISDGQGNIVKQWKDVTATRGVFSNELQLSKNPVLGNWNISVTIHKQSFNTTVQVATYVLPKFLVKIECPKHITFKENILTANIQAMYTYGKKLKGDATVTVFPTIYSGVIQPIFQIPVRKVVPIDGSATVNFDISKELELTDEYERTVVIDVTVEEELTGKRQNNSVEVQLHKYDYKMELIKTADYYKPGLKYTAYVKVQNHNGMPIEESKRIVTIRHGYSRVDEVYAEEKHKLDSNGMLKLELYPPRNSTNQTALRIEAEYLGLKERMPPIPAARSASNNFIQVSLETDKPLVNLDVEFMVNSTEPMKFINYQLLGRGDVLIANTFTVDNKKEFKFHFIASPAMVPTCHLLVNYVRDDGELVADTLDIEIDGLLQNFIEIQMNTVESRPDSDIDLTIRAQPNSYIALLAVDEKLLSLKNGFDVNHMMVSGELRRYDIAQPSPYLAIKKNGKSSFDWKQGNSNAHDIFHDSGALLLTNALVNSYRPTLEDIYLRPVFYNTTTVKPDRGVGLSFNRVTRPPLAGPYAFSRIPRPVWDKPKVYLAENIYDTWLFTNFSAGFEGKTSIRRRIPSSLNSWVITGFSLDPLHGLGIISSPKTLKVTKPFIVSMDLPNTVQRKEVTSVPVVVTNNLPKDLIAEVTIHNPEQKFSFADTESSTNSSKKIELYRRKKVTVRAKSASHVTFMITPLSLGDAEIKVSASSSSYQDTSIRQLTIKAEGEPLYFTKTVLLDLRNKPNFKGNVTFEIPKNAVDGSESVEVSAVGDLLGPTIINLENLIHLPTGCAEQNLINFMPNLIILNYLRNTRQLTPTLENQAIIRLETSYQEQLKYKMPDGSFMVFGKNDEVSNVWITAYTAYSFLMAKPYIYIDNRIITSAYKWLSEIQGANGSFVERGPVIHQELAGRNGKSLALTAYTVMSFIEYQKVNATYQNTINKGLDYIARNIDESESAYTISICAYVLQMAKHPNKQSAFNLLESKAKYGNGSKWWAKDFPESEKKNPWHALPKSIDIEATSYGLLTFLDANLIEDAMPIVNWLVNKQNNIGGFASSQDTTIALQAIYKLVLKLSSSSNMRILFSTRKQETNTISINRNNAMIIQKVQIAKDVRQVNITAEGSGIALLRVSFQYNMNVTGPWPMFILDPQVDKNSNQHHLQLSVCTQFVAKNLSEAAESNMAIMEVNLPSGFTADLDALPSLEVSQNVQKVETANGDTTVLLYFNNITRVEYCPTVSAFQTQKVANQKPAYVSVYDYYDSSRHARIFYKSRFTSVCNICEAEDCGEVCKNEISQQIGGVTGEKVDSSSSNSLKTFIVVPILLFLTAIYF